ncbi:hypothetical protein GT755_28875 [Herbidospora sp. NEAU-GS84]|uniref:DUF2029 domain-containing protein n=1 Tax=Herbidospora solisilvae TaxID=2696284 RepID=A0A7C9J621_9ACTN|nr:hypothetical protein [Herbidospora solisilvae]NAS25687.1 hypothetical protein [Herbidospora solisilvae]
MVIVRRELTTTPTVLLAGVALLYFTAQLLIPTLGMGIGWDEAVYASQYAAHAPPAVYSAPRAQGVSLLVAPIVAITDEVVVLRLWLSVVSSAALFGAFAVWLRVRNHRVVPLAALLLAGCWLSVFYGNQAMPNLYVALGAVAATGFLLIGNPLGLGASMVLVSLMRPTDALVLAVPLAAYALWRRSLRDVAALAAGLAIGWGQWAAEAVTRFGGVAERLGAAGEHNDTGLTSTLGEHARALDGPALCRFGVECGGVPPALLIWWIAIPLAAGAGLWTARRTPWFRPLALATATAVAMALPYFFYVDYAAPRFLLPAYALLALPVATAVLSSPRPALVGVAAHLILQGAVAVAMSSGIRADRDVMNAAAEQLRPRIDGPCVIYGQGGAQLGYLLGCESQAIAQRFDATMPARVRGFRDRGYDVIMTHRGVEPPAYTDDWQRLDLPGPWRARLG